MPLYGASESFIMKKKLYIIPLFLTLFSFVVIYLSLQLDTSPEMIVGDSMQARSFPIFLMVINLLLVVTNATSNSPSIKNNNSVALG